MMAHPDAYQCLYERLLTSNTGDRNNNNGMEYTHNNYIDNDDDDVRAYRTYAYDVYLPPPSSSSSTPHTVELSESSHCTNEPIITTTTTTTATTFVLFLPGAFVEQVSYAQPAALLSDQGYIVIVLSSESSWGIVDRYVPPFTVSYIQHIQQEMEQKHGGGCDRQCRWVFMGHSMGSLTCTKLVTYFPNVHELVLWGSAPFLDYMENLSHVNDDNNNKRSLNVLVVQGTKDDIIQRFCTPEMVQEYWNRLPTSTTTLYEIIGGTHHGFGNYIRNSNNTGSNDDTIPIHEQHAIAVQVTIDFLNQTTTK
jgi:hypothetical protein